MIDVLLLALLVAYAISGFRQGVAVGALSLIGFVGGAVIAMWLVPPLADRLVQGTERTVLVLVGVLLLAWLGQLGGALLGSRLREQLTLPGAQGLDQLLGAVAGVVAVSLVLWFIGGAVREISNPGLARAVAQSRLLATIDTLVPPSFGSIAARFRNSVSNSAFPRVFAGVAPEQIVNVPVPDTTAMPRDVQQRVRQSVVKITGDAPSCSRGQEGSGAVVAGQRVITNAHVVAGVRSPRVQLAGGGPSYAAQVVLFDPKVDVAVLAVPGLPAPALPLGRDLARGADAIVAGFPENGPYTAVPARVRSLIRASGGDIYGQDGAVREVYALFAKVEQGNSGGPLVAVDGSLAGIVFAKSLDDASTGYALTFNEVSPEITAGVASTTRVSTGGCAAG